MPLSHSSSSPTADSNLDRTSLVPAHTGPDVFPNSPFFSKLLRHARRGRLAVRDVDYLCGKGVEKTYGDVCSDALSLRAVMERTVAPEVLEGLRDRDEEVYIGVLAAGGYEFTVAAVAVLALGAAVVPIAPAAPVSEAAYFVTKARLSLLLVSDEVISHGRDVQLHVRQSEGGLDVPMLSIKRNLPTSTVYSPFEMVISSARHLDDNAPGVVIFTSGTTGRPKGAVMRRAYPHETALAIGEGYDVTHTDVLLHVLPVHHTTGLQTSFFVFLVAGACIEFKRAFDPAWVWRRWLAGGLTVFSAVPTILLRLKWHYERQIAPLPQVERARYDAAANQFREIMCGSSALQDPVQEFWTSLRGGRPILTRYGATEFPGYLKVPTGARNLPKGCVGLPVPGVEVKLVSTEGDNHNDDNSADEGELLVRSPYMFSKYLFDTAATKAAHDAHGFFKTGDILRREKAKGPNTSSSTNGKYYYFVVGRASVDIVKSGGYKISAVDVERACLALAYIDEVAVLGVDDEEFGQRVAALVVLKTPASIPASTSTPTSTSTPVQPKPTLTIERLRDDLRPSLAAYKLPTLLRVVHGELPKGGTGKVQKKMLGPKLFPSHWRSVKEVQAWDSSKGRKNGEAKL